MQSFNQKLKQEIKKNLAYNDSLTNTQKIKYELRKLYLSCGHINNPKIDYNLEFIVNESEANYLLKTLNYIGVKAHISIRDKEYVVYIKNKNSILKLLDILGSNKIKSIYKKETDFRYKKSIINRKVNFEVANLKRTVNANIEQMNLINGLLKIKKLENLDENTKEIVLARLNNPTLSLSELSKIMGNISKSTLNYRFNKIKKIVNKKDV